MTFIQNEQDYFQIARNNMVKNQILPCGLNDDRILEAFQYIPKQLFISDTFKEAAYTEGPLESDCDRKILDSKLLAKMIYACQIQRTDLVLDIGCGLGYSSFLLARLAKQVIVLENNPQLVTKFKYLVSKYNINNCMAFLSNFIYGYPEMAPFDVIFINGSFKKIPKNLIEQLDKGGRAVLIESPDDDLPKAVLYTKLQHTISREEICIASADNCYDN